MAAVSPAGPEPMMMTFRGSDMDAPLKFLNLSQRGRYDAGKAVLGLEADETLDGLAVLEQHHGGNAHNVECLSEFWVLVDVELGNVDLALKFFGDRFDCGLH